MGYHLNDEGRQVWTSQRDTRWMGDPLRLAGERLADRVETYLFDTASPHYMDPVYLAWVVSQFDVEKGGTGNYAQLNPHFDRESYLGTPFPDGPPNAHGEMQKNIAVHAPAHLHAADHIDTAPAPTPEDDA